MKKDKNCYKKKLLLRDYIFWVCFRVDRSFLSDTLPSNISNLKKVLEKLKEDKLFTGKIIVGGQALFINDKRIQIEGADFIAKNLDELENYLEFKH